ncbi:hypothetical protein ACJX0J_006782, partial [Zea mays]
MNSQHIFLFKYPCVFINVKRIERDLHAMPNEDGFIKKQLTRDNLHFFITKQWQNCIYRSDRINEPVHTPAAIHQIRMYIAVVVLRYLGGLYTVPNLTVGNPINFDNFLQI